MAETKKTKQEFTFPTEVIDIPSRGKLYGSDSPLSDGKVEIKYMTAREEDILTSQNLIKKGLVIEKLLDSLIITPGVKSADLTIGDKNAVMVAARILAYGPEYKCEILHPDGTGEKITKSFNLTECPFTELDESIDYSKNEFDIDLPTSKVSLKIKILTGHDEKKIEADLKGLKKIGQAAEITTRLKRLIIAVNGETSYNVVNNFVDNMLSRDSLFLRDFVSKITPDIILKQEVDIEGDSVEVDIPMTVSFFWPKSEA
jgi:hypothetical protein